MTDHIRITQAFGADPEGIAAAAAMLLAGDTVAFPTETVYGLGADATNAEAVTGIYSAKDRPRFNPLIVHVASVVRAEKLIELPPSGRALARALWPGPLTLVGTLRPGQGVSDLARAGLTTLGVRVPDHPVAQGLLRAVGRPIAAPSANPSGRISATTAQQVHEEMAGRVGAVLDGGPAAVGIESTIIGFDMDRPVLLRPGGIPIEAIADVVGSRPALADEGAITAPGQLASHYAPVARVRSGVRDGPMIGFGDVAGRLTLSEDGDLSEAAARLFTVLREADALVGADGEITVAPVPFEGLGAAINDRLTRAGAPRG